MGDRLGIPGAVSFCFSFTGQLTHFSKLQHSCVLLYPFKSDCCFFLPFDFSVTSFLLSVWQKTAQPLRSSFLLQGAIDRLFLATTWEMYPLRFQVQNFKNSTTKQILKFKFFWCLVTGQKLLASEQIKYSAFSRTFLVLGNRTRDSSAQKKFNEITIKVRANIYLFIYYSF